MSLLFFGTDGIRGEYGGPILNDGIACRAGIAGARLLKTEYGVDRPVLIVGRDTRNSGVKLLKALAVGFEAEGGEVESIGVAPTPAIAKVVALSDAHAGCSITASHNPSSDNGLKFFQSDGTKPTQKFEKKLDEGVGEAQLISMDSGREVEDAFAEKTEQYVELVQNAFPSDLLKGKRVALDCANGAMSAIAPQLFKVLGAEIDLAGFSPDGENINEGVGSECPQMLQSMYSKNRYDFGFAFDGDGDRVIAFDQFGKKLAGEAVLGLLALRANEKGDLREGTLVTTAQSNLGLDAALKERGVSVERVDIGDKFVSRLMKAKGYSVGGEESGHVVLGDFSMTGDGLFAALKIAQAVIESNRSLSELGAFYKPFPQQTRAIKVASKPPLEQCENLVGAINELENALGEDGRLLIRYSGTEPKLRLLVEAKSDELAARSIALLERAVAKDLG